MDVNYRWIDPATEAAYNETLELLVEQRRSAKSPEDLHFIMRSQKWAIAELAQIRATCCLPEVTMTEAEWNRISHLFPA